MEREMNKYQIRDAYCYHNDIGYDYAIQLLMKLGFTEYAADQFLFAEC